MKFNKTIAAVVALAGTAGVGMITPATAMAASFYPTNISVNGTTTSTPEHTVSYDGSTQTSFLPIWYINQALPRLGVTATWNGITGVLNLEVPSTVQVDLTNLPSHQNTSPSLMAIAINGTVVDYAPRMALHDPANGVMTTYAPIYYLENSLNRIGITSGWDGANWSMSESNSSTGSTGTTGGNSASSTSETDSATKLDVVKAFATALGIQPDTSGSNPYSDVSSSDWGIVNAVTQAGYFTADSSTEFGSNDPISVQDADHAYQLYVGIPDSHMSWNAGGNTVAWANAIKLNYGFSSSGNMTASGVQAYQSNLTNLNRGYSVNSDGWYQLWFKPYDAYTVYSNTAFNNAAFVSSSVAKDIQMTDDASIKQSGSDIIWKIDDVSESDPRMVLVRSIYNDYNNQTWYSFNGGDSWTEATGVFGYSSTNPNNGGKTTSTGTVMIKTFGHSDYGISEVYDQHVPQFTDVQVDLVSSGVPKIAYSSGM